MKILSIVGARPNFMKVAPLHRAFAKDSTIESRIIHTGQHYDAKMSDVFFNQLELPKPDYFLGIGGGSHTVQTAKIMLEFEQVMLAEKPDVVLVVGDVNSTIACATVAVKEHIPVVHVEAGLRSGDRRMPEEINRIMTDSISDQLFVTESAGMVNLRNEGVADEKVHFVGNVMIDSLVYYREKASKLTILDDFGLEPKTYVLVTMHRPSNVDDEQGLKNILEIVRTTSEKRKILFPVHPRTLRNMETFGLLDELKTLPNVILLDPQGYLEFLQLMANAELIITDSGGIQEETTFLQVPCITFRASTERPVTVELGTNYLLSDLNPASVNTLVLDILEGNAKKGTIPPLWDGRAAERIAAILKEKYAG
ncbi:UDP-2,3-diacetamido-2,3-dideoxy-D-glucuronate 2-epimerase [Dyadobacter sp. CECT 9275]|uniref:UDP-2,3-diacetamido-2,3-dideoxy-D-glucuronate 2-epimerase n=1 Tax=Dyadobacter helix TaxID=2822344 RepID=A0A916J816_9BACT|nr:UDP-N-acetylglucosamine 2-epimerase (non-hydrolyzing) [Dyadobacter sp. CECT 9275]CAG4991437.1 UDP-2,3-diacetamido-2,3-dideoxy-D-glucuronate 2-epimerase [Dyadobacter sp. CECT 9275]